MYKKFTVLILLTLTAFSIHAANFKKQPVAAHQKKASKKSTNPLTSFNQKKAILGNVHTSYGNRLQAAFDLQTMIQRARTNEQLATYARGLSLPKAKGGIVKTPTAKKLDKKTKQKIQQSLDTFNGELASWTKKLTHEADAATQTANAAVEGVTVNLADAQQSLRTALDQGRHLQEEFETAQQARIRLTAENSTLLHERESLQTQAAQQTTIREASDRRVTQEQAANHALRTQCEELRQRLAQEQEQRTTLQAALKDAHIKLASVIIPYAGCVVDSTVPKDNLVRPLNALCNDDQLIESIKHSLSADDQNETVIKDALTQTLAVYHQPETYTENQLIAAQDQRGAEIVASGLTWQKAKTALWGLAAVGGAAAALYHHFKPAAPTAHAQTNKGTISPIVATSSNLTA